MVDHVIISINYIERKPHSEKYRIVDKGVTVDFLSLFINDPEWPLERICEDYNLTPAEVHAAWSFYYDHQHEIDTRLAQAKTNFETAHEQDHLRRERLQQQFDAKTKRE